MIKESPFPLSLIFPGVPGHFLESHGSRVVSSDLTIRHLIRGRLEAVIAKPAIRIATFPSPAAADRAVPSLDKEVELGVV